MTAERKVFDGLARLPRYPGQLFLAAAAYLALLVMEGVSKARLRLLTRRRSRQPHRAIEHDALQRRLRRATAERWHSWQQLPRRRRTAVRLAAIALIAALATGSFSCAIGHAVSTNGVDWRKSPEPVIVPDYSGATWALGLRARAISATEEFAHLLVIDGELVGRWRRTPKTRAVIVDAQPFRPLTRAEDDALEGAAAGYSKFLQMPVILGARRP